MIILDTNVISEIMREVPQPEVVEWLDNQPARDLFITAITEAEVRTGIEYLPSGRRRRELTAAAERAFGGLFAGRILPFDSEAARSHALIAAIRRSAGRPISQADCQIAAIARSRGAQVATRNLDDFEGCGVGVVNPWSVEVWSDEGLK
jgi:predicted nucleic acid-binding protein